MGHLGAGRGSTHQRMYKKKFFPGGKSRKNVLAMGDRVQFLARDRKPLCYIEQERI